MKRLFLLLLASMPACATDMLFLCPGLASEPFWQSSVAAMQTAARQLDIRLEVLYADRNAGRALALLDGVVRRPRRPDYLIVSNERLTGVALLQRANTAGIPTLLAYAGLTPEERARTGAPRTALKHWLGTLAVDNRLAGRQVMQRLIEEGARHRLPRDGARVLLLGGDPATPASNDRIAGARDALAAPGAPGLSQSIHGQWNRELAREQVGWLLRRHPEINLIWSSNELMALGARDAARAIGRTPGRDILFGAFNNTPGAMNMLLDGSLPALAAGHFMIGAYAVVMLYDYDHGHDFSRQGSERILNGFTLITPTMARHYLAHHADNRFDRLDFRRYSATLSGGHARPFDSKAGFRP